MGCFQARKKGVEVRIVLASGVEDKAKGFDGMAVCPNGEIVASLHVLEEGARVVVWQKKGRFEVKGVLEPRVGEQFVERFYCAAVFSRV